MRWLIDWGADANVLCESDWNSLTKQKGVDMRCMELNPRVKLSAYAAQSGLTVLASFRAWIRVENSSKPATYSEFYAIKGGERSLLRRSAAKAMRILETGLTVNAVSINEEFPAIPGVVVNFDVDESIPAVRQAYVSIPAHFREPAMARIREMERTGIIERVCEAPRWLSGLSAVPKGKGDFRLVVNMRGPNRAIRRQYHYMPRVEEIRTKLARAKWFSKLDLASAFHHMRLSETASELTTFMAPDGMYRFRRLVFGVN